MAVAVLGIDPGRKWTAAVLRLGVGALQDRAVHGWTLGPVDAAGLPDPAALDNVHDLPAFARYMERIVAQIDATIDTYAPQVGPVALAVEVVVPGAGKIKLVDWLTPRQVLAGLIATDPQALLVATGQHGKKRPVNECYPPELWPSRGSVGGRPAHWGPSEARRGERDHERAAWDIAGAGVQLLTGQAAEAGSVP